MRGRFQERKIPALGVYISGLNIVHYPLANFHELDPRRAHPQQVHRINERIILGASSKPRRRNWLQIN